MPGFFCCPHGRRLKNHTDSTLQLRHRWFHSINSLSFLCSFSVCWIFFLRSHSVDVLHQNLLEYLWKEILEFHPRSLDQIFGERYRNFYFQKVTPLGDFYPLFYIGSQVFSLLGASNILVLQLKYEFSTSWETPVTITPSASSPTGDAWIFCGLVSKG